jgi:hypothetical protein
MGIGFWSVKHGLSEGLPVDVMRMLLAAAILRLQILEGNPEKKSKVILLLADSMAIKEGAEENKVVKIVSLYKKSLEPLVDLLGLKASSEILLSSDLEENEVNQKTLESIKQSETLKEIKKEDKVHYAYIRTQTAITEYMNNCEGVGIKIGWICKESSKQLSNSVISLKSINQWDELTFDLLHKLICPNSTVQCVYTKAGWRLSGEKCPYTAFSKDQRITINTRNKRNIIYPPEKRVVANWKGVVKVCTNLIQAKKINDKLLLKDCIKENNDKATVCNMLNYWINIPMVFSNALEEYLLQKAQFELILIAAKTEHKCILI